MPPLRGSGVGREAEDPEYAGAYRLEACLGSGGMGVVHLARSASGLRLAVKVVHEHYASDAEFRARFRQEVAAARRVSGAFTAPVVDADPEADRPWMATLYVPGPTLAEQVKRNGPLARAELRRLTAGLAEALRDIHRAGVVHRDLKPGNVLLTDTGPKVIDFGISRPVDSDLRTETGKLIGSPPYMAPEQFQRPRQVGPAADVFALGSVLVHAATGRGPFDSDSPYIVAYQVVHDEPDLTGVPEELAELVARCLAKEPAERPTPDEIMAALLPPSYEAAAFIPAQRRAVPAAPVGASEADAPGDVETRALRASGGPNGSPDGGRRRRRRWPLVTAATLAVLVGGGVWAAAGPGGDAAAGRTDRAGQAAAAKPFSAWRTALPGGGDAAPVCSFASSDGGGLYCAARGIAAARIDPATGRVLWSSPGRTGVEVQAPVLAGGLVGTVTEDGTYRTYAPGTGAAGWSADVSGYLDGVHPVGDTLLMASRSGEVTAMDGATGARLWRHGLRGHVDPRIGPYDAGSGLVTVFEAAGERHTLVTAVRVRTGEIAWQQRLARTVVPVGTAPSGALLLTELDRDARTVAVVRREPGTRAVTRVALPFPMTETKAVVDGGAAYLLSRSGTLVAVDTDVPGGRRLWQLETAAGRVSRPSVGPGDRLYFSAADGRLLAVDTARGVLLGQTDPRLRDGRLGHAGTLPAPLPTDGKVFGSAPDGSVFAVESGDPARW
ncbi:protein kinase [Streptomyces purpureus]|uniref:serine/threonine-protein kinase n=1 Tax=Streptomyces purpureus TaxID=1951 RepID=UPI0037898147